MKVSEQLCDGQVIEHVLSGEIAHFELLIRKYNPFLYKTGRTYNYNHEDTQDLMQDSYVEAYKHLAQFEHRSSFKTWIIKIMLHQCYRKRQKSSFKYEIVNEIQENSSPMFANTHRDTAKVVAGRELNAIIEHALQTVPFDYRMVFTLREITGLNVAETAETLDISEANVKVRLNRAKKYLRTEIEKSYTKAEIFEFNLMYCDAMLEGVMKKIRELESPPEMNINS